MTKNLWIYTFTQKITPSVAPAAGRQYYPIYFSALYLYVKKLYILTFSYKYCVRY